MLCRSLLLALATSSFAFAGDGEGNPPLPPLNVLWIIGEDLGPELECYGTREVRTPHLNRLAAAGARFTRAFSSSPVCSPSRSGFMTGMYPTTIGAHNHRSHRDDGYELPAGVRLITDWVRPAGYFTANLRDLTGDPKETFFRGTGKTDWNFHVEGQPFDGARFDQLKENEPFFAQVNFAESPAIVQQWEERMKANYDARIAARAAKEAAKIARKKQRPNVVLVMTDDQGYGDFGFQGNPVIKTPHLDSLASRSARMETFYVSPVCAPTRAALMTGRWCQRTRAIDTWLGRAMMEPEEVTVAELLRDAGWATGIFGKWHLGDCYPMRAIDQGFEEALVHLGGGIGQPSDPEGGEGQYTDAVLFRNGERVATSGYCTDVYFDAAIDWMRTQHSAERPFFSYIATNAPHGPFHDVPPERYAEYAAMDLSPSRFPNEVGHRLPEQHDTDRLARIFSMITNIDDNVGKLFTALEEMDVLEETLVLFLVDNGPNTRRYVAGMRGRKGDVYEGGVRSPFLAHWPSHLGPDSVSDRIAAHVDVMPTLLDACGVPLPAGLRIDGRSLLPLLEKRNVDWPDRTLVVQAHRGDAAVRYHHFFARNQRWKLLNASGFGKELESVEPHFELYDMQADPLELVDLAAERPGIVAQLRAGYDAWFDDVGSTRPDNYAPPRILLGAKEAPEVHLTRQDWRRSGSRGGWNKRSMGHWELEVLDEGPYQLRIRFLDDLLVRHATLRLGSLEQDVAVAENASELTLDSIRIEKGPARLQIVLTDDAGTSGPYQVIITRPNNDTR